MNILKAVYVAVLVIIGFQTNLRAAEPVVIDKSLTVLNISRYTEYAILTPDHDFTIHDITSPGIRWEKIPAANLAVADGRHRHWLRFTTMNTGDADLEWYLELDSPFINRVYLYTPREDGMYSPETAGFLFPFNSREVKDRNNVFRVNLPPGRQTCYLKIEDEEPLNCNITIMSAAGYNNKLKKELPFFWFFYGLMGAMIIYNLFIYSSIKDRAHLYYVLFISTATLFCFMNNGFGNQYIWRNNVYMAINSILVPWSLLPGLGWAYVSAHDDMKCKSVRFFKIGLYFIAIPAVVNAVISLYITKIGIYNSQVFVPFVLYLSLFSLFAVMVALVYLPYSAFILKSRTARIILAAFLCMLIFIPVSLMGQRGVLPSHFLVRHAYQVGFAVMTLMLSFSLADKINIMKDELLTKLDAQMALERSRQKLKHTEEKYRNIFENALEGIFQAAYDIHANANGYFLSANPAMMHTMGYDSLEDLNKSVTSFSRHFFRNSTDRDELFGILRQDGQAIGFETQLRRKNGSLFWATLSARNVRDENDQHLYYEGTIVDITDRKKREEAEKNYEAAKAASLAKSDFLAGMSHEIRTPMNAIIGFTNLALQTPLTPKQYDYLLKIKVSAGSLIGIINDILDFSKIEAGKLDLETVDFNLTNITNHVVDLFAGSIAEKKIKITVSIGDDVPCILTGDPLRLGQILINLTGNAVKFTEKGEISINIRLEEKKAHHLRLEFMVTDTGIGMTEEQVTNIFTSYTQAERSTTRKFGGTGLGLNISKRLVEMMNGNIRVESTPQKGSRFIFTAEFEYPPKEEAAAYKTDDVSPLPMETASECRPSQDVLDRLQEKRILVVEDNEINRQVAEEILQQAGLIVHTAKNGREAVEAATSHRFDAILMDIEMPVMNGYDATRLIRNTLYLTHLPIIAMTAHAVQGYREECLNAGMDDYITKPIDTRELLHTLSHHIPSGSRDGEPDTGFYETVNISDTPAVYDLNEDATEIDIDGALGRMDGDRKLLSKVLSIFALDYADAHKEIKEMLNTGNMDAAKLCAHSVKGAASNFGAEELCIVAEKLENTIEKGDSANFNHLISDFEIKLQRVLTAIERIEK